MINPEQNLAAGRDGFYERKQETSRNWGKNLGTGVKIAFGVLAAGAVAFGAVKAFKDYKKKKEQPPQPQQPPVAPWDYGKREPGVADSVDGVLNGLASAVVSLTKLLSIIQTFYNLVDNIGRVFSGKEVQGSICSPGIGWPGQVGSPYQHGGPNPWLRNPYQPGYFDPASATRLVQGNPGYYQQNWYQNHWENGLSGRSSGVGPQEVAECVSYTYDLRDTYGPFPKGIIGEDGSLAGIRLSSNTLETLSGKFVRDPDNFDPNTGKYVRGRFCIDSYRNQPNEPQQFSKDPCTNTEGRMCYQTESPEGSGNTLSNLVAKPGFASTVKHENREIGHGPRDRGPVPPSNPPVSPENSKLENKNLFWNKPGANNTNSEPEKPSWLTAFSEEEKEKLRQRPHEELTIDERLAIGDLPFESPSHDTTTTTETEEFIYRVSEEEKPKLSESQQKRQEIIDNCPAVLIFNNRPDEVIKLERQKVWLERLAYNEEKAKKTGTMPKMPAPIRAGNPNDMLKEELYDWWVSLDDDDPRFAADESLKVRYFEGLKRGGGLIIVGDDEVADIVVDVVDRQDRAQDEINKKMWKEAREDYYLIHGTYEGFGEI